MAGQDKFGKIAERAANFEWYAIQVVPQKEFVAQEIMRRQGFVTYVPVEYRWRKWNKYTKKKEKRRFPMLPRYLFVGFEPRHVAFFAPFMKPQQVEDARIGAKVSAERHVFNLFSLPIVTGCIGSNGEPRALKTESVVKFVNDYPDGFERPAEERFMPTGKEFKIGDSVMVLDGPFEGRIVPVVEINAINGKARIIGKMFGADMEMEIALGKLAAA